MGALVNARATAAPAVNASSGAPATAPAPAIVLVWIDTRQAAIARWDGEAGIVEHLVSDVPVHHSGMGHVRHTPDRHGGGQSQDAEDHDRLAHLERFLDEVAGRLEAADRLVIIGPGTVREHLERLLREADAVHRRDRLAGGGPSGPLTDRQLVKRLREIQGDVPRRRSPRRTD
jgi:hypothetical protein